MLTGNEKNKSQPYPLHQMSLNVKLDRTSVFYHVLSGDSKDFIVRGIIQALP